MNQDESSYVCPSCGEEIVVPVEPAAGAQEYVEDCPVCCCPVVLRLTRDADGWFVLDARAE